MATTLSSAKKPTSSTNTITKPTKVGRDFFGGLTTPEPEDTPETIPAASPASKRAASSGELPLPNAGAVGKKKRGPKPKAEPLEPLTVKVKREHNQRIFEMLADAPRHVTKQDLIDFLFVDFFSRHPTLPEALRTKKPERP